MGNIRLVIKPVVCKECGHEKLTATIGCTNGCDANKGDTKK